MDKVKKESLSVPVIFQKLDQYSVEDTRFTKVKIWLMHTGINENGSYFDKESIMKATKTLANTPILAYVEDNKRGERDFSDHRYKFVTKDGERQFVYAGSAYGTIPESHDAHFEYRLCDDGIEREYLVVNGLIWNKIEDGMDILSKKGFTSQSVELVDDNYDGFFDEDGIFHFTHFVFYGACMIGIDHQPAMTNSTVEVAFCKEFKDEIRNKLEVFYKYTKGDAELEDKDKKVDEEKELTKETITDTKESEKQDFVKEDVEKKEKDLTEEEKDKTEYVATEEKEEGGENPKETEEKEVDDKKEKEVVEKDSDKEDFKTKYTLLEEEHNKLKFKYEKLEEESTTLKEFKDSTLKNERMKQEKELFKKYDEDLSGIAEYEKLKETTTSFTTLDDLEKEVALLFARNTKTSFTKNEESTKVYFENNSVSQNNRYGYLAEKYKG